MFGRSQIGSAGAGCLGLLVGAVGLVTTVAIAAAAFSANYRSMGINPAVGGVLGLIVVAFGGISSLAIAGWGIGQFNRR